ncbi:MAG TPA: type II toxin-antitoxin system VapC family toxin [Isosphaeraceae bacterium]|jgi:tRNA(fMet)-specific endonuclease VapC
MTYLLDTNTCIRYLKGSSPGVLQRLNALGPRDIAGCSVVKAELFFGALRSHDPAGTLASQQKFLNRFISLPFDDGAAEEYARIRAHLSALGLPIGPNDYLIAAIALTNGLTLVTHNTREFRRVPGLQIEDWEATSP